jgi:sugar lactone lactonase YvrE
MSFSNLSVTFLFAGISLTAFSQKTSPPELFKSSILTPTHSSTVGVEGPGVSKKGVVYYVNFVRQGTIGQISPNGDTALFIELPEGSIGNGIRFDSKGNMLIADYTQHNILKVDMATKKITVFAHESRMSQPNDIAIDSKDRIYASDPNWKAGTGKIWRIDTDASTTLLDSMGTVNGIDLNPEENILYVNSSRKLFAYDLSPAGDISNKRLLIEFTDGGMDGMRCDIKGNLNIARFGRGVVAVVSPEGKLIREVQLTGKRPTNVAFGGKDGCTVYVTLQDQGNLEWFRTDIPGREWKMQRKAKH